MAIAAHTFVVASPEAAASGVALEPITGKRADVMNAAYIAAEVAARTIRPGNTNRQVTEAVKVVSDTYGVQPIAGTLMHQVKRFVLDASKVVQKCLSPLFLLQVILLRDDPEQKIEEVTFEENEVYIVDVAMSSGEGKPREGDTRTTVFKRNVDRNYNLKIKASRVIFSEINKKFPTMPFTIRALEDERQAKLGVRECMQHQLLTGYPVLYERHGDFVAHVKFTILLLPNGNTKITGLDLPAGLYVSSEDKVLPEATRELLAAATKTKKSKKKKAATQESES